jgi:hypothetical protein
MEMTKKPPESTTEEADIPPPSPFVTSSEREELERLVSSTSATRSSTSSSQQNYIPTAVPKTTEDRFDENAPVAIATSVTSLPPADSAYAAVSTTNNASTTKKESSKTDDKLELLNDDIKVEAVTNNNNNFNNIPTASTLPTHTTHIPATQQQTTQSLLRAANVGGQIRSEEEFASVERAARHKPAIQSNTDNLVQIANTKAKPNKSKQDEGLTVDEGIHHLSNSTMKKLEIPSTAESDIRPYSNAPAKAKGGGYETKEYETKEYATSEYETEEYKSVYDD